MDWSFPSCSSSSSSSCSPLCSGSIGATASGCSTSTSPNGRSGGTSLYMWRLRSRRREGWRESVLTGSVRGWEPDAGRRGFKGLMVKCPFWCSAQSISLLKSYVTVRVQGQEPDGETRGCAVPLLMLSPEHKLCVSKVKSDKWKGRDQGHEPYIEKGGHTSLMTKCPFWCSVQSLALCPKAISYMW